MPSSFEREALRIIKSIVSDLVEADMLELRPFRTRTIVSLRGKRIIRLHEGTTGTLAFAVNGGHRISLRGVNDLYSHRGKIRSAFKTELHR